MADCELCRGRGAGFSLREPFIGTEAWERFDPKGGYVARPDGRFECPTCGALWRRRVTGASMFHDYDEYDFERDG
jgi:hypothetical protein